MRSLAFALFLSLAAGPAPVELVAIKDATIVVAPLVEIEKGTIVIRDGLIDAVGKDVPIPRGAEILDGKDLVVYPGFFDGHTALGLPDTKRNTETLRQSEGEKPNFTKEAPPRMEQANRKGLRPDFRAAHRINLSAEDLKKAHGGGFALAVVSAKEEYLAGHGALLTLSGRARRNALVRNSTGMHASFRSYGSGYPRTTMGAVAHLRQILHDADHHRKARAAYTVGRPRPAVDPTLDALAPVLEGKTRVFFHANTDREILRAVRLSEEFGFTLGITGGGQAHRVTDVLAKRKIPVILSLKLPDEPKKKKHEPQKLHQERMRIWKKSVGTALALQKAKVRFCFSTSGLKSPGEALGALRRLVDQGLPEQAVVAALTTSPARIFGVHETHGSIQKGKAANLTLLTGRLGTKDAAVRYVIADGTRHEFEVKKKKEEKKKGEKKKEEKKPPVAARDADVEVEADRRPAVRTGGSVFIRNARILTVTDAGTIENGSILIRNGRIEAVGRSVAAPEGMKVIDASGLTVMPGIIDCHSHIANEGGLNEGSQTVTPEVRVKDVINHRDVSIYRAAAGGTTTANILHGSANAVGGQNAVIKLKYGARPSGLLFPDAPLGVKFALGENPKQSNFTSNRGKRFPISRMGVEASFRRAFAEALEYEKARKKDPLLRRDLRLDALVDILNGKIRVHCHCYRADEILMILRVAREFGFKISTLQHVLEGYRVAPEIAAAGAGGSTFSDWWSYKIEAYEAIPHNAALMTEAGVVTSLNSDSAELIRHLNIEAAKTVKYGRLSERQALEQVTLNPAIQLGIERSVGSIAPGKDGDLAFFNGHPLSIYSRCVMTLIDGEVTFEDRTVPNHAAKSFSVHTRERRAPGPLPQGTHVAITGATVHPVSSASFRGTIVLRDGKIADLGPRVKVPAGAERIDGAGLHVYPGLIDSYSVMGLTEIGSVAGTRDEREIGSIQPDLETLTAVNPHSEMIPVTRANGITTALTVPRGGLISGQSAVIRLNGWTPGEMAVKDVFALHVDLPGLKGDDAPNDEDKKTLKEAKIPFEKAKRYTAEVRDIELEALVPYVNGERPVVLEANRAKDIMAAVAFAEELGLKPIILGGRESWKVAEFLAEKKVPVILAGVMTLPYNRHDPYDATYATPARLKKAGVLFSISSAEHFDGNSRNTPYHAGWAVAHGLDREEAVKAVTLSAARILGIDGRTGSLEKGKDGDVIVTTGDPLEVVTDVVYSFIGGRAVSLDSKHTRSYRKFRGRIRSVKESAGTR